MQTVRDFYLFESVSRHMPGMKDFVSVTVDGEKKHLQEHLVLCIWKKCLNFSRKQSSSKFCWKQCILARSSGMHSVCVCTKHQNVKLKMWMIIFEFLMYMYHVHITAHYTVHVHVCAMRFCGFGLIANIKKIITKKL